MTLYQKLVLKLLLMIIRHQFGFAGTWDDGERATIEEAQKAVNEIE